MDVLASLTSGMPNQTTSLDHDTCKIAISLDDNSKKKNTQPVYHPGDTLTGSLWILYSDDAILDIVTISFEGISRTFVDHATHVSAVQHDLLKQSQRFSYHDRKTGKAGTGKCCSMPFRFRIAARCFPHEGIDSKLSALPPSMAAGEVSYDRKGHKCMQPLILYGLRAVVIGRKSVKSRPQKIEGFREVVFSPRTEASPPVSVDDFPGEFRLSTTRDFRKYLSVSSLGQIKIGMGEPTPLISSPESKRSYTHGLLTLTVNSLKLLMYGLPLPLWSCNVQIDLIQKTYYSTMPLTEVVSDKLAQRNEYIRKRERIVHSQAWKVNPLCWNKQQSGLKDVCTASIPLTISPRMELLPTFSIPLTTLRYSFRATVRIPEVSHGTLIVEAPLQVHSCRNSPENAVNENLPSNDSWPTDQPAATELPPAYCTYH